jgi:hypothetical protein
MKIDLWNPHVIGIVGWVMIIVGIFLMTVMEW